MTRLLTSEIDCW